MTILSTAGVTAAIALIDDGGENTAAEIRVVLQDIADSTFPYGDRLFDGADTIALTATPTKVETFAFNGPGNDLFSSNLVSSTINILEPLGLLVGWRVDGDWASNEDAVFELYINGAPVPGEPVFTVNAGRGASNPTEAFTTNRFVAITQALINAGAGGNTAQLTLMGYSNTGNFTLAQTQIAFGVEYVNGTVGAIG